MIALLPILFVVAGLLWYRNPRWWGAQVRRLQQSAVAWKIAAGLWCLAVVAAIVESMPGPLILAIIVFVPFWLAEVRILLSASDAAFPGQNDKLIWALYLLFCPPVGLVFFRAFREKHWASAKQPASDWL